VSAFEPLSPQKKWRAITIATVLLVPGFWSMLAGLVALASEEAEGGPDPGAAIALGFALLPFVYVALAFLSLHPGAPMAVLKAMGLSLLVGLPISGIAGDAVTGMVAGVGAGGVVALRAEPYHRARVRVLSVAFASLYTMVLVRLAGDIVLLSAPILPLTAIGLADHFVEWRAGPDGPSAEADET
jgi:hypothetical protein